MDVRRFHPLTLLLLVWGLFILYGTLLPFDFDPSRIGAHGAWSQTLAELRYRPSIPDVVSNVLLFLPWGGLLAARLALARRGALVATAWACGTGFALSACVELLQLFLPRTTSWSDLAANALGALAGGVLGGWVMRRLWPATAPWLRAQIIRRPFAGLALALLALIFIVALEPYRISIDIGDLKHSIKTARIVPFGATLGGAARPLRIEVSLQELLRWLLVGGVLGLALREAGSLGARGLMVATATGAGAALAIETAQLAFVGHTSDATSVVVATAGSLVGSACTLLTTSRSPRSWIAPALAVWFAAVVVARWTPFQFDQPVALQPSMLVPFYAYYTRTDVNALMDFITGSSAFMPLGALLAARADARLALAGALGFCIGLLLEVGQLFIPGRTAEITDALSAGLGAVIGLVLWHAATKIWESAREPSGVPEMSVRGRVDSR